MMKSRIIVIGAAVISSVFVSFGQPYFVSPAGDDLNPGTLKKPFATLQRAQEAERKKKGMVFLLSLIHI